MTVEEPLNRRLSDRERRYALGAWHRIAATDGSTIAYVPDRATAERIVELLMEVV